MNRSIRIAFSFKLGLIAGFVCLDATATPTTQPVPRVVRWQSFDVPGAGPLGTSPAAINDLGEIAGNYADAGGVTHGFLRSAQGHFTTVDPPGGVSVWSALQDLNNLGDAVGNFVDAAGNQHGLIRSGKGRITIVDVPVSGGISSYTQAYSINDQGEVLGSYVDASGYQRGFLREPDGQILTVDAPGVVAGGPEYVVCGHINARGEVACQYMDLGSYGWNSFLRQPDGAMTPYSVPGAGTSGDKGTFVGFQQALTLRGEITGEYSDSNNGYHGYLRHRDGTFDTFSLPIGGTSGAAGTYPSSLNGRGTIVGFVLDANFNAHGFVRAPDGTLLQYDAPVPGAQGTQAMAVNSSNEFTGSYADSNGTYHGFTATLQTP